MKKITILFLILLNISVYSQKRMAWETTKQQNIVPLKQVQRLSFPKDFKLFDAQLGEIKAVLQSAPNRLTSSSSNAIIVVPNANGGTERFQMFEFSNFAPELQAQFPNIRSYIGIGIDDKNAQIRMSLDESGIQAMIFRTGKRNEFIEPYSADGNVYAVYESSRAKGELPFTCSTVDTNISNSLQRQSLPSPMSSSGELLLFRLALSCNGEYTAYFGGTVAGALAAMNATMTRVNGVFEKDLSIHMNLIANNSVLIYTNAGTDPYTTVGQWNTQLQNTLNTVIGNANYDIGHMFGSNGGGGSAGCIGCVCVDGIKGSAKTSPSDGVPMGDTIDIDYYEKQWHQSPRYTQIPNDYPKGLSNIQFARWLINNVLGEPRYINSYMESRLIRDLNYQVTNMGIAGMYFNDQSAMFSKPIWQPFNQELAFKHFVQLGNRKNYWEQYRWQKIQQK
jgi:hypothetical protein